MPGGTLKTQIDKLAVPKVIINEQVSYNLLHKSTQQLKQVLSISHYK
jgi:hypothetical protein